MFGSNRKRVNVTGPSLGKFVAMALMGAISKVAATPNSPMLAADPRVNAKRQRKANRPSWRR